MKVKVLGSAAAEAMPALWCECRVCQHALQHGGKDLRRRTCYLIDEDTLVDYGPDIYWQVNAFNVDLLKIRRLVMTHSHSDHFSPVELHWRRRGYSVVSSDIDLYSNEAVVDKLRASLGLEAEHQDFSHIFLKSHILEAGREVLADGLHILPIPAKHAPTEKPYFFVFTRQGRSLLIANDTGFPEAEAWELLSGCKIDLALLDCCGGAHPKHKHMREGHMGAETNIEFRLKMLELGIIDEKTPVYANHFSHNCLNTHEELCQYLNPQGILVAYDGLELQV
ncbi:MAG: MBL fold metallo-hydrolase [Lentisphaeria bacterium]|jgi:phosphoribosyl 1,2-cyclic phosphate phosphodiesterase|nr:MBL fold metallo-hydrolase [Lentisphaeria bacterium]MDY0176785.1 MBL fold metallo-hydrolase [Lentisphaeria bacterium]